MFVVNISLAGDHKKLLELNSELGHALDKAYYDAGTKVDIVIFDLKELKRQGKKIELRYNDGGDESGFYSSRTMVEAGL